MFGIDIIKNLIREREFTRDIKKNTLFAFGYQIGTQPAIQDSFIATQMKFKN